MTRRKRAREKGRRKKHGLRLFMRTQMTRAGILCGRTSSSCFGAPACLILPARISITGSSEYKLNDKVVTYSTYNAALIKHNILVKAKNFLVFQGDVEAVASQSPRDLTRLIEQISGSLELEKEYESAKLAQERATENATTNFTKRRGITGEIKQYKEQKSEADRFEALVQERVRHLPFI
jgi:chromosome segregation ATPase